MSLSEVQSNDRRDSFSDRVCDDLCQHILQYLSLEERLRLECVSKQFQRTAFKSELMLGFNFFKPNKKRENINFEILFKKLPGLNVIRIPALFNPSKQNEINELIIKYCDNLTHFYYLFGFPFVDKDIQKKFFEKFGHKLVSVSVDTQLLWALNQMPNIEELNIDSEDNQIPNIHFKRLKRFTIDLRLDLDLNEFKVFIERNDKTITHLNIYSDSTTDPSRDNFKLLLTIVSNLKNLVHLNIRTGFGINDNSFTKQLSQIALNCNQLKSLEIDYELELKNDSNGDHFSPLKKFKRLKRLRFNFINDLSLLEKYVKSDHFLPFKGMNAFQELTHFRIYLPFHDLWPEVSDIIFTDIDINLPKLQYLSIYAIKIKASKWTVVMMSRLTRLESITLCLTNRIDLKKMRSQLTKNCKKFRKIYEYKNRN